MSDDKSPSTDANESPKPVGIDTTTPPPLQSSDDTAEDLDDRTPPPSPSSKSKSHDVMVVNTQIPEVTTHAQHAASQPAPRKRTGWRTSVVSGFLSKWPPVIKNAGLCVYAGIDQASAHEAPAEKVLAAGYSWHLNAEKMVVVAPYQLGHGSPMNVALVPETVVKEHDTLLPAHIVTMLVTDIFANCLPCEVVYPEKHGEWAHKADDFIEKYQNDIQMWRDLREVKSSKKALDDTIKAGVVQKQLQKAAAKKQQASQKKTRAPKKNKQVIQRKQQELKRKRSEAAKKVVETRKRNRQLRLNQETAAQKKLKELMRTEMAPLLTKIAERHDEQLKTLTVRIQTMEDAHEASTSALKTMIKDNLNKFKNNVQSAFQQFNQSCQNHSCSLVPYQMGPTPTPYGNPNNFTPPITHNRNQFTPPMSNNHNQFNRPMSMRPFFDNQTGRQRRVIAQLVFPTS